MLVLGPRLAVALVLLTAAAAAIATVGRLGHGRQIAVAAARAALQLAAVSLVITAIVGSLWAPPRSSCSCARSPPAPPAGGSPPARTAGGRASRSPPPA
ncbi:ABC transporter permease [Micromonospora sp. BRA006-A]|nr:ABC transporter permease [Micromonospora sp. BRA006-A]